MKDTHTLLLLHVVNGNGNVKRLLREGVSFKDIGELTSIAIEKGYITYEEEKVTLTFKGKEYLKAEQIKLKKQSKDEWIEKDLKNKIPKLDKKCYFYPIKTNCLFSSFYIVLV